MEEARFVQNRDGVAAGPARAPRKASRMRLLAPAGGPEQLRMAIHFGADEVYLAGREWGMRARSRNFSRDELAEAVRVAHAHGVSVHLALNTLMLDDDIDRLPGYLRFVDGIGVDAAIVADLGAIALVRECAPHVDVHVSTQASVMNARAAEEYARLGARRIVLARELSVREVAALRRRLDADGFPDLELEVFAHGSMCMAVSGRCLLSSGLVGRRRGASFGACTQPCRWSWELVEQERPDERRLPVEDDGRWSYLLSSNDLEMLDHLDDLAEAGVAAIKLEGRAKGAFYTAMVTNAYRHVLDGEPAEAWMPELDTTSHRPFSQGFFYGNPTQNPGRVDYARESLMVATVERCRPATGAREADDDGPCAYVVEVLCRNKVGTGAELEAVSPGQPVRRLRLEGLEHWDALAGWEPVAVMSRAMERYRLRAPFPLAPLDVLRV